MSLRRWTLLLCVPLLVAGLARAEEALTTPGAQLSVDATCNGLVATGHAEPGPEDPLVVPLEGGAQGADASKGPRMRCMAGGRLVDLQFAPQAVTPERAEESKPRETRIIAEEAAALPVQAKGVLRMLRIEADLSTLVEPLADEPARSGAVLRVGGTDPLAFPLQEAAPAQGADVAGYGVRGAQPGPSYNGNVAAGGYVPFGGAARVGIGSYLPPMPSKEIVVGGILLGFLGIALYQRFTPAAGAQHERRALLLNTLMGIPEGATAGDLGRLLGMNRKTVDYHLTYLVRLGKIRESIDETGARRYSLRALPERKPLVERTLEVVRTRPGLSVLELSETLGVSRSAADRHTKALVIQGVLESRLVDGERRLFMATA